MIKSKVIVSSWLILQTVKHTKEVVDLLTAAQKDLEELDAKLDGEEVALNFINETVKKIRENELIHWYVTAQYCLHFM